jgi:hypothetical protein
MKFSDAFGAINIRPLRGHDGFPHIKRRSRGRIGILPLLPTQQSAIQDLLNQTIGFDRSAFAAGLQGKPGNQKTESCCAAIHGEGLLEHPIKNSNQASLILTSRIDYEDES